MCINIFLLNLGAIDLAYLVSGQTSTISPICENVSHSQTYPPNQIYFLREKGLNKPVHIPVAITLL